MELWERQPNEPPKAWEAFVTYRDMGLKRSNSKVGNELGKSKVLIDKWSSRYRWVSRCKAYDEWVDSETRRLTEEARRKMAERHARIAMAMQSKIAKRLERIEIETEDGEVDLENQVPIGLLDRWLQLAVNIERLSRGEPTEYTQYATNQPLPVAVYEYGAAIAAITSGPIGDSAPSGEAEDRRLRTAVGQDDDGGEHRPGLR